MKNISRDTHINAMWERLKSGDEKSLSEIFTIYYADLYLFGIKIVNLPDLVKDSIQDVFVRIWEKRATLGEVQNLKAYLLASVRRKLLLNKDRYSNQFSSEKLNDNDFLNFSFVVSEFQETAEISEILRNLLSKAINDLPERQRELIFLRFYYNLHYKDIAQIMEVNGQTVKNLMQRALAGLRERVDCQMWKEIDNLDELLMVLFYFFQKKIDFA